MHLMVSCKIACEDVNDHSIDHSTIFTKTSPDSINPHPGGSPSDFKFGDTKVISYPTVLRSPQCKNLGTRLTGMIEWRQKSKPPKSPGDWGGGGGSRTCYPLTGFLSHSDTILTSSILLKWGLANWQSLNFNLESLLLLLLWLVKVIHRDKSYWFP